MTWKVLVPNVNLHLQGRCDMSNSYSDLKLVGKLTDFGVLRIEDGGLILGGSCCV